MEHPDDKVSMCSECSWWSHVCQYDEKPTKDTCGSCGSKLIHLSLTVEEWLLIRKVSKDPNFIKAMIDLKEKDIIEYELKMSQFRNQVSQQKTIEEQKVSDNTPKCPHCHSTKIKPITGTERAASVLGLGILSKKLNKSFKCLNCKYTW